MSTTVADLAAELRLKVNHSSFNQGEKLLHSLHRLVEEYFAFEAVKKVGEFFKGIVEGAMESAHSLEVMSQQIGVAIKPLQELQYAAKASGTSAEGLVTGVSHFALVIGEANKGSKEASDSLRGLGKGTYALLKANAPLEDVLGAIADQFHEMPDGTKKTALAMKVFGRGGRELIPFLNKGKAGLADLRKEFVDLGGELDEESIKQLNELHHSTIQLGTAWDGIKNQIAIALVPALQDIAGSILEWVKAHRELIATKIHDYITLAVEKVREFWNWLHNSLWPTLRDEVAPAIMTVVHAIGDLVGLVGGAGNALKIFLGYLVVSRVISFGSALLGMASALGKVAGVGQSAAGAIARIVTGGGASAAEGVAGAAGGVAARGGLGALLTGGATAGGFAGAGLVLGAGALGYAGGTAISHSLGLNKGDAGYNDDYRDPLQAYYSKENIAKRRAMEALDGQPTLPQRSGTTIAPSFSVGAINVNVAGDGNGQEIGTHVRRAVQDHWDDMMRDTHAAVAP